MRWAIALCAVMSCSATDLAHRIDALVRTSSPTYGIIGIHVADAATGKLVYSHHGTELLLPASNMKLFTAALALNLLGPDYRFQTRIVLDKAGDLRIIGGGDPSFSSRIYPFVSSRNANGREQSNTSPIDDIADQIVARGIHRIDGGIIGDDSLYPWEPFPPSWTEDDVRNDYGAPVSALTLDDNVVSVTILPGPNAGGPAVIFPSREYLVIENRIVTGPAGEHPNIRSGRVPGSRQWILSGTIPAGTRASISLPVDDPALFAAAALYDALTKRGVAVRDGPVARHRIPGDSESADRATSAQEITARISPRLSDLLETMLKLSLNLHAELLLREAGRVGRQQATTEAGLAEMTAFFDRIGIESGEWRAEDGSGLSRNDLVTPRTIARLLSYQYAARREQWISLLPAGGVEGTLDQRLCCVSGGLGIVAKTGTLGRALALSGYARSRANGTLAFSILVNNFSAPATDVQRWIDKIAEELLK